MASGVENVEGNIFETKMELIFCKGIELFAESIPGKKFACLIYCWRTLTNSAFFIRPQAASYKSMRF